MLGAVVKVSKIMDEEEFLKDMVESFKHKFANKPEVVEGNIKAWRVNAGGERIMSKELRDVKPDVTWKEITSGGVIDSLETHIFLRPVTGVL